MLFLIVFTILMLSNKIDKDDAVTVALLVFGLMEVILEILLKLSILHIIE